MDREIHLALPNDPGACLTPSQVTVQTLGLGRTGGSLNQCQREQFGIVTAGKWTEDYG